MLLESTSLLVAQSITCCRDDRPLFSELNFTLSSHQIMQVVGLNGVGKTTLLRSLTGALALTEGKILWRDQCISICRERFYSEMLYVGHRQGVKGDLTVMEALKYNLRGMHYSQSLLQEAITEFNLAGYEQRLCRQLSQGQRQRVALIKLLLAEAALWILDEPFASLDAVGVIKMQQLFAHQIGRGGSIVFTTHRSIPFENLPVTVLKLQARDGVVQ